MSSEDSFAENEVCYTFPVQTGALRKGDYVLMKNKVCKVLEIDVSKPGKHGHCKATITGRSIFDGNKVEDCSPVHHNMLGVDITKEDYDLTGVEENGCLTVCDELGQAKEDLRMDTRDSLFGEIRKSFEAEKDLILTVISTMGRDKVISYRIDR